MTRASDIANSLDTAGHAKALAKALTPRYLELVELGWDASVAGAFDLHNPNVKKTITQLAKRVTGMADSTKDDIRGVLERAFSAEKIPSVQEIAKQLREAGITTSRSRSLMIARTETAVGFNQGAITSYREANVTHVEVLDGDEDEDCASVDGTRQTLEWAEENPVAHPNCVRAFVAVVD